MSTSGRPAALEVYSCSAQLAPDALSPAAKAPHVGSLPVCFVF
jgi:hypothetical protein